MFNAQMLHASQSDECDEMLIKLPVNLNARADLDIGTQRDCLHVMHVEVHGQRVKKDVVNKRGRRQSSVTGR